jgi:hypothetical protein
LLNAVSLAYVEGLASLLMQPQGTRAFDKVPIACSNYNLGVEEPKIHFQQLDGRRGVGWLCAVQAGLQQVLHGRSNIYGLKYNRTRSFAAMKTRLFVCGTPISLGYLSRDALRALCCK